MKIPAPRHSRSSFHIRENPLCRRSPSVALVFPTSLPLLQPMLALPLSFVHTCLRLPNSTHPARFLFSFLIWDFCKALVLRSPFGEPSLRPHRPCVYYLLAGLANLTAPPSDGPHNIIAAQLRVLSPYLTSAYQSFSLTGELSASCDQ